MKRTLFALALLCVGCSPPFQGAYQGEIKGVVMCQNTDEDPTPASVAATITISQVNDAIAAFGFGCEFWGNVKGSAASLTVGFCDPSYAGVDGMPPTIQTVVAITGGTLALHGSTLDVTMIGTGLGESGNPNGCAVTFSGSPQRQPQ